MDESGVGRELSQRLKDGGEQVVEVYRDQSAVPQTDAVFYQIDPASRESFQEALQSIRKGVVDGTIDHLVYLWGLDAPDTASLTTESLKQSTQLTTLAPMHLVQAWENQPEAPSARLMVATSGAQSQDGAPEPTHVSQGPLLGFARVIASEYAKFQTKLIDIPAGFAAADIESFLAEIQADDEEDEVMWRGGHRFVHRFTPHRGKPAATEAVAELACQLRIGDSAGIEELHYETKAARELGPHEVEIEVIASGLNFSDVMKALDLYPGLPDGPVDLGAGVLRTNCSGRQSERLEGWGRGYWYCSRFIQHTSAGSRSTGGPQAEESDPRTGGRHTGGFLDG